MLTIVFSPCEPTEDVICVGLVGGLVTVGLTTAANDVLGLAGEGDVGLNVNEGRSLEEIRIAEGVEVEEGGGLDEGMRAAVGVRVPHEERTGELDGVNVAFELLISLTGTISGSDVKSTCFGTIVDALLDEEDDAAEPKLASVCFTTTD